jgi:hypothetical protein
MGVALLAGMVAVNIACGQGGLTAKPEKTPFVSLANTDPCVALGQTAVLGAHESRWPSSAACQFQWRQTSAQPVALSKANRPTGTFWLVKEGLYEFELTLHSGTFS